MPRLHAAVAAHVEIPALLGGDHADVLALRLGAFARAAGDGHLDLVRRAQATVAVLDVDRHRHRVLHAVAAPGIPDTRLYRSEGLPIGVSRFEPGGDQLGPDVRQLLDTRAEKIDALRARDLAVQAMALRDFAQHDQFLRRDLAARHARHDRVRAVLLQIGEEVVVRVLQRSVLRFQDHLVPAGSEDRSDRRLANVAALAGSMDGNELIERADVPD